MSVSTNDKENDTIQRIVALKADLDLSGKEIIKHITSLYSNTANTTQINLKSDPRNALKILKHDVMEILELCNAKSECNKKHTADLDECEKLLEILKQISDVGDSLIQCEDAIGGPDILYTCKLLSQLEGSLKRMPNSNTEVGSGSVCTILRREGGIIRHRFHARLKRLLRHCIQFDCGFCSITKKLHGIVEGEDVILENHIQLSDIWSAVIAFPDLADACVDGIMENCWKNLLIPLWKERKGAPSPRISSSPDRAELICAGFVGDRSVGAQQSVAGNGFGGGIFTSGDATNSILHPAANQESLGACRMTLPQLLDQISQVLGFLCQEALLHINARRRAAIFLTQPPLSLISVLVDTCLSLLPGVENELAAFQRAIDKPCRDFEIRISTIFDTNRSDDTPFLLNSNIGDLFGRFAEARRRDILGRARHLLLSDYHNTMLSSGDATTDDPASAGDVGDLRAMLEQSGVSGMQTLRFEPCMVSLAACRLLKLLHEVMGQCSSASPAVAQSLYQSTRDCLELFMAIVPQKFAEIIESTPRMGAVFFNDCLYVAHNCILLIHNHRSVLSGPHKELVEVVGLTDYIPRLRALGERFLSSHVEQQRTVLGGLVVTMRISPAEDAEEPGGGIFALAERIGGTIARGSGTVRGNKHGCNDDAVAASIVKHLELVCSQWDGVLSDSAYQRSAGFLTDSVLKDVMQPLLQVRMFVFCVFPCG